MTEELQRALDVIAKLPAPPSPKLEGVWSRELVKQIAMDIGTEAVHHLEIMYPAAIAACPDTMKLSLRNHIHNNIMAALETIDADEIAARLKRRKALRRAEKAAYSSIRQPRI